MLPGELLERTEVVAGPVTGGALLAHTMAGLLDGRRALTPPAVAASRRSPIVKARPRSSSCVISTPVTSPAGACCSPTTCGTRGDVRAVRRARRARRRNGHRDGGDLRPARGGRRSRRAQLRARRVPGAGELPGGGMPDVPRRRADHDVLSILTVAQGDAGLVARAPVSRLQPRGLGRRSGAAGAAVRATRGSGDRRVLRRGAGLRPGRQRARLDLDAVPHHGRPRRRSSCARSIRRRRIPSCGRWCTAGRAASISPRCCGSCGRCSSGRDRSRRSSPRAWRPADVDVGGALDSFSRRALGARRAAGLRPRAEARRRLLLLSAAVGRQRLQAAEPVPALDGAQRRSRSRRLAFGPARAADRAARHAHHPARRAACG